MPPLSQGNTITTHFNEGTIISCDSRSTVPQSLHGSDDAKSSSACDSEEVALLMRPLSSWASKMLGFFSFPVKPGDTVTFEELGCVCWDTDDNVARVKMALCLWADSLNVLFFDSSVTWYNVIFDMIRYMINLKCWKFYYCTLFNSII